ncbi:MAG: cyclic nucleotide-binding domain-containing protein [Acidimicrobiia bacterium]
MPITADVFEDSRLTSRPRSVEVGETLIEAGCDAKGLHLIDEGTFSVRVARHGRTIEVATVGPGTVVGEISLLAGGHPTSSVIATTPGRVRFLPADEVHPFLEDHPGVAASLAAEAKSRVDHNELVLLLAELARTTDSSLVTDAAAAFEVFDLPSGSLLFEAGDPADAAYLVVSGRLAVSSDGDGGPVEVARLGRGQVTGEAGLLERLPRNATVIAVRDSVVARIDEPGFERLLARHPRVMAQVARQIVERMVRPIGHDRRATSVLAVAVTADTNTRVTTTRLLEALGAFGSVGHLTAARVGRDLGRPDIADIGTDDPGAARLGAYLHEVELSHDLLVVEVGDRDSDAWARRAFGLADRVLLVVSPEPDEDERAAIVRLSGLVPTPTTVIGVVHHPTDAERPRGSVALARDLGFDDVLHVRAGSGADLGRVARLATSRGVALVLGGGGARGFAHLGVFRALTELGIPVDLVAGSSMGAPLAGGIALGNSPETLVPMVEDFYANLLDYTLPLVSLIKGERINRSIEQAFGGWDFEDMWIPFRCVSTNLTRSRTEVHRTGPVHPRVRASVAIPGVMPPVPDGDDLLVDGGALNNLPVDVVAAEGRCSTIIAVDVAPTTGPRAKGDYGLSVSGWDAMKASMGKGKAAYPGITAVLLRSMLVGSLRDRQRVVADADVDLLLQLDLRGVGMLEFDNVRPVAQQGYDLAKPLIEDWLAERGGWA